MKLQWININDHAQMLFWFYLLACEKEWNFSVLAKLRACFDTHFATKRGEDKLLILVLNVVFLILDNSIIKLF